VPVAVVEATVKVIVELPAPGAAIGVGVKLTVTPVGWPLAVKATAESKPPETVVVIVELLPLPCTTVREEGEAERGEGRAGTGRSERVDQAGSIGTAPAGHKIITDHSRIAARATARDVVKICLVVGGHILRPTVDWEFPIWAKPTGPAKESITSGLSNYFEDARLRRMLAQPAVTFKNYLPCKLGEIAGEKFPLGTQFAIASGLQYQE